jgi:hypothetical protein
MSDDFDKRSPPADNPDDDLFAWLRDDQPEETPAEPASDRLGFTGELSWRQDDEPAASPSSSDEPDEFAWLRGLNPNPAPSMPEEPPGIVKPSEDPLGWLKDYQPAESQEHTEPPPQTQMFESSDETPDFFAGLDLPASAPEPESDPLSWLKPYSSSSEIVASDDEPVETDIVPGSAVYLPESMRWLQQYAAPEPEPELEEIAPEPVAAAPVPVIEDEETPDWLREMEGLGAEVPTLVEETDTGNLPDDLFGDMDAKPIEPELAGEADAPNQGWFDEEIPAELPMPDEEDFLRGLPTPGKAQPSSWFDETEEEPFAAADEVPDWLKELQPDDVVPAPSIDSLVSTSIPQTDNLAPVLDRLRGSTAPDHPVDEPVQKADLQDIDALLASYEDIQPTVADQSGQLMSADIDFEQLLSDDQIQKLEQARAPRAVAGEDLQAEAPDWLTEVGGSVGGVSAAAILRKQAQTERPLEELPDRLQALHDAGVDFTAPEETTLPDIVKDLLPADVPVIAPAPLRVGKTLIRDDVVLSDAQRQNIAILQSLVAAEDQRVGTKTSPIIDDTDEPPELTDIFDQEAGQPVAVPVRRPRYKIDRLLVALFVALAVVAPFLVRELRIGQLPPSQFRAGSPGQAAFDTVQQIGAGQPVLIAAEYGPTGAAELDSTLETLLRHLFVRGAVPVIAGGNPIGLLHARNVVERIAADTAFLNAIGRSDRPLTANVDYVVTRYLAGEAIGLRTFSQDIPALVETDLSGQPTGLQVESLSDFALIMVIAERAEDVRGWSEQVAPLAMRPLVFGVSFAAAPLAEPYARVNTASALPGIGGLLVGYRDAYTYQVMLDAFMAGRELPGSPLVGVPQPSVPEATETVEPTIVLPTATVLEDTFPPTEVLPTTAPTLEPTAQPAEPTTPPTVTPIPPTPLPPTAVPTQTLAPSATPTQTVPQPTPTQETTLPPPSATSIPASPTAPPVVVVEAEVIAGVTINVRQGPGRTFAPLAALPPGTVVQVIGRNADGLWLQVRLADEREGWVLGELLRLREPVVDPTPTARAGLVDPNAVVALLSDSGFAGASIQQAAEPTANPLAPQPPLPASARSTAQPYRDERWYGMTLGLVAIIAVIAGGAVMNILRALITRGRKQR